MFVFSKGTVDGFDTCCFSNLIDCNNTCNGAFVCQNGGVCESLGVCNCNQTGFVGSMCEISTPAPTPVPTPEPTPEPTPAPILTTVQVTVSFQNETKKKQTNQKKLMTELKILIHLGFFISILECENDWNHCRVCGFVGFNYYCYYCDSCCSFKTGKEK